jgi:hypothetical protein
MEIHESVCHLFPSKYWENQRITSVNIAGIWVKTGTLNKTNKQTPWPESESELFLQSDRRLSAKLVPTFADRGFLNLQNSKCLVANVGDEVCLIMIKNWLLDDGTTSHKAPTHMKSQNKRA